MVNLGEGGIDLGGCLPIETERWRKSKGRRTRSWEDIFCSAWLMWARKEVLSGVANVWVGPLPRSLESACRTHVNEGIQMGFPRVPWFLGDVLAQNSTNACARFVKKRLFGHSAVHGTAWNVRFTWCEMCEKKAR